MKEMPCFRTHFNLVDGIDAILIGSMNIFAGKFGGGGGRVDKHVEVKE